MFLSIKGTKARFCIWEIGEKFWILRSTATPEGDSERFPCVAIEVNVSKWVIWAEVLMLRSMGNRGRGFDVEVNG